MARGFSDAERAGRRRLITGAIAGAAGIAAFADLLPGQSAPAAHAATSGGAADWLDVAGQFGADPTGATDSTAAIQAAITACPAGGVVYFPAGKYTISQPLLISGPGVRLQGSHAVNSGFEGGGVNAAIIDAASGFTGIAMIDNGGQPDFSMRDLDVHGTAMAPGTTAGINLTGGTNGSGGALLENVVVSFTAGFGIVVNGGTVTMRQVGVFHAGNGTGAGSGFDITTADSWFTNCLSAGHATHGWAIRKASNSTFTACRAEDGTGNTGAGFSLTMTGTWGGTSFSQCTTDKNAGDGFVVSGVTGAGCVQLNGCEFRRDGYNNAAGGGGYSGIRVASTTVPVVIDGTTVTARQGDQSSGADSPADGLTVTNSTFVSVNGGFLACAVGGRPVNWDGAGRLLVTPGLLTAVVAKSSQTLNTSAPYGHNPSPYDQSLRAWSYDPALQAAASVPSAGVLYLIKIPVYTAAPIASILVEVVTVGSGLTANQNFAGLYSASGTLIGKTADQSSVWTSSGMRRMALAGGPFYVSQGWVYVALLANGKTRPAFGRATAQGASAVNVGLSVSAARYATNSAGKTSLPSSITMSGNVLSSTAFWAALA